MANQAPAARTEKRGVLSLLEDPKVQEGFNAVATKHLTSERMLRLCISAVKNTPKLAQCTTSSVLGAMMTSQSLGLEPNTALGHAYLIPYKRKQKTPQGWKEWYECQFQLGYKGLLSLAMRQPNIIAIQADAIHENDEFDHCIGSETILRFKKTLTGRGELVGAFVHVRFVDQFKNEGQMIYVMPLEEIEKIRQESDTWVTLKQAAEAAGAQPWQKKNFADTPWEKWLDQMAIKSAIKRACKMLDLGGAVAAASELDSLVETGKLDISSVDATAAQDIKDGIVIDHETIPDQDEDGPTNEAPPPKEDDGKKKAAGKKQPPKKEEPEPEPEPEPEDGPPGDEPPPPEPEDVDDGINTGTEDEADESEPEPESDDDDGKKKAANNLFSDEG